MNEISLRIQPPVSTSRNALPARPRTAAGRFGCAGGPGEPALQDGAATAALLARIRQLESQNRRLRRLSITDELTGAYNHRHFSGSFATLIHKPTAPLPRTTAIALCLFDIDHFKAYNDAFGHPTGDAALRAVSMAVRAALRRESDRLFRFGGDEFGSLLLAETPDQAMELVTRFQVAIGKLQLTHPLRAGATLSASFGIAWHPAPARDGLHPKQLYSAADDTLYAAKQGGRNRILMRAMPEAAAQGAPSESTGRRPG
ncbi:diguanylate cyclase [Bordetella petrii]|nr:diguanylate cyclase [Bordetella petrii]